MTPIQQRRLAEFSLSMSIADLESAKHYLDMPDTPCDPRDRANVATLLDLATRTRDSLRREIVDALPVRPSDDPFLPEGVP